MCRIGSPALDLAYYLFSSTTKQFRDQYLDELLHIYHSSLAELMTRCGSEPEKWFTFNDLQNELKKSGIFGLVFAPATLQIAVSDPKDIVEMGSLADAIEDAEQTSNMVNLNMVSEEAFRNRLSDAIADATKYGWI